MTSGTGEPLPARMLNELAYCPRLFHLEHVHREWADSADTVEGRAVHRRVDRPTRVGLPEPTEEDRERPEPVRSVTLADPALGIIARIDLVEVTDEGVVPIDYKRGVAPDVPEGAYEPERVQVCAQALLLRAHGYRCSHGVLYFAASRRRVRVEIDDALVARTLQVRDEARRASEVRPLLAARDDGLPLYVRLQGGAIGKDHEEIVVREKGKEVGRARMADTSRVVVYGNASLSTPVLHSLADADIPAAFHSYGGWFRGVFLPASGHNVHGRIAQHAVAADPARALGVARGLIRSKIHNQRVLLREELRDRFDFDGRNRRPPRDPVNALLSFGYACLVREVTQVLHGVGLDPYVGVLHRPRAGRPALALDLMEEFRPLIADSATINAINNGVVGPDDFLVHPTGVALKDGARSRFIEVIERRLDELVTHPVFETRLSYRRVIEIQGRLLSRVFLGELDTYPEFRTR